MSQSKTAKVIVITGCSSGFGLLMAARLSSRGHCVFATMRDLDKRSDLLKEVEKRGGKIELLQLDVVHRESIKQTIDEIKRKAGRIDVLINNAGFGMSGFFEDLSEENIHEQMETNFFGVQNVTRAVLPNMRQQRNGKIINISSVAGLYALPSFGAYNASKWALEGYSESLYYELKPFGIDVCLVEPGTYNTKIFHENARFAKDFANPSSPYFELSQFLRQNIDNYLANCRKDPEYIAYLVEKIINTKNPSLRHVPDFQSKVICLTRRFLPFRIYSWLLAKVLFYGFDFKNFGTHHRKSRRL